VEKLDIPQGTLDLMILTILAREPLHGYGISQRLAVLSHDQFQVNPGSLFPSLYRLEQDGKLKATRLRRSLLRCEASDSSTTVRDLCPS
jgi:DNA-binding PadR family transcriptional regulator